MVPALLALALLACAPDPINGFRTLVFPAEAELGGSAAVVINSNYIPEADSAEDYTLDPDRVTVEVTDTQGTPFAAALRSVFPLAAAPTSKLADSHPGAWVVVALFDLPTADTQGFEFPPPYTPYTADVTVSIDDVPITDPGAIGSIRITGAGGAGVGGQPTSVLWPSIQSLELRPLMVRLRPVRDTAGVGFPDGVVIAGLEADLVFLNACLKDFQPYAETEAVDAHVEIGPLIVLQGFISTAHLTLTNPDGFTLAAPAGGDATVLGEGPLIDITFDRPSGGATCTGVPLSVQNVFAVAPGGSVVADERGAYLPITETSGLFTLHAIARE